MSSLRRPSALNLRHATRRFRNIVAGFTVVGVLAAAFFYVSTRASGATYYSKGSLAPELITSWSSTRDGLGVGPTNFTSGDIFVIQNTHNMSTVTAWTVSGSGSTIHIESGGTLTANNIVAVPTFQVDNGGTYIHNAASTAAAPSNGTSSDVPGSTTRTFGASSTVEFQKWANGGTGPAALPNVAWGNLKINVATLAGTWQQSGALQTVNGNLIIQQTGGTTREFRLNANSPATVTTTVAGDLQISGGIFNLTSGTAVETFNLGGNFTQTGGTFTATGAGPHSITFTGGTSFVTFTQSAGTFTNTNINWSIANGKIVQLNNNFTLPASRSFGINAGGMLLAAATFTNNGAVNVTGEFRLTDGGFATGTAFTYVGGTLGFVSSGSYAVNNDAYWPTTNGPTNVTVLGGGMTLNVARTVGGLVQTSSGISGAGNLTVGSGGTMQVNTGGFFSGSPVYSANSLLKYNTGASYNAANEFPSTGVQNVTLGTTTQLNLDGDKTIAGTFDANSRNVGSTGANPFSLSAATVSLSTGTLNLNNVTTSSAFNATGAASVNVAGNWNVAGFSAGASSVNFNGAGSQTLLSANTFNNLTASNDIALGASTAVNGTLALGSKKVSTGASTLSLGLAPGAVTRTTGYVVGSLLKNFNAPASFTFPVGTANGYSPVDANSTTGTGSLAVTPAQAKQPNVSGTNALARYWKLSGSGITTNLTFHYLPGDVIGTEANYQVFKYAGGAFTQLAPTPLDTTNHTATVNGVNSFSDWTLAETADVFGSLQFSAANYDDTETNSGSHNVTVNVKRTGGTSGAVSVHYATSDGTAIAGSDYTATSGTLNFADGDSADKTFTVSVNGDTTLEPDETINLTLSAPAGGAALGSPSSATITVQNDDAAPLSGTKTVCASGCDYTSLTNAGGLFETVNNAGLSANLTVQIAGDLSETGTNALNQWTETGAGGYTLTVQPDSATPRTISGNVSNGMIRLDGADRVTIDGRFNGAGRYLLFRNTSAAGSTIALAGDASNDTIRSSVIEGTAIEATPSSPSVAVVSIGAGATTGNDSDTITDNQIRDRSDAAGVPTYLVLSAGTSPSAANSNGVVSDNELFNFRNRAVYVAGVVAGTSDSWTVTGNNIYQTASRGGTLIGVSLAASGTNLVAHNVVHDLTTSGSILRGISLVPAGSGTDTVSANRIYSLTNTSDGTETTGIGTFANDTTTVNVVNNQISVVPSGTNDQQLFGLYDQGAAGTTVNLFYNSVLVGGTASGASATWACQRNDGASSAATWRNNVCVNARTGGGANHFAAGVESTTGSFSSDYNLFVGTGATASDFFDYGTNVAGTPVSFSTWQSSTGGDAHSQASNPGGNFTVANLFTSATDLHLNTAGTNPAVNAGIPVAAVTTDYDGETRDAVFPEVGADEVANAPALQFSSATYTVAENVAGGVVSITVTRTGSSTGAVSVDYATSNGTAAAGSDYTATSGTLSFADGEVSKTFTVSITDDSIYEGDETVSLALSNPTGAGAALGTPSAATLTITDDDSAPTLSIDDVTLAEGNSGTTAFNFTVTKTGATALNASVNVQTQDGTATAGSDYVANSGTLTFLPADTTKQFTVQVNGDTTNETNETFTVQLSGANGATISTASGTGTITNDDAPPPAATVYVDDDWASTTIGADPDGAGPATSFGYDAFATVQAGATAVASSGTVNVLAGTYTENVVVAKPLTISGAGEANVTIRPALSNPNCGGAGGGSLCAGHSSIILVQANDVTVTGLTLDGDNPGLTSGVVRSGADIDARNGIITNHTVGSFTNLVVHHTTVKNIYLRGVYNSAGGDFNFHHNTVSNVQGESASIGLFNFGGGGTFDNNTISDCNDAIASNHSRGTQFTNNHITASASGIHTDNAGDQAASTADTISNNTVADSSQFGYGIWAFVATVTVDVHDNVVTNTAVAYASAGSAIPFTASPTAGGELAAGTASQRNGARKLPVAAGVTEPESAFKPATRAAAVAVTPNSPVSAPNATFTGNTADGQNRADSTGVYLTTDQFGFGTASARVLFNANTVENNTDGFFLEAESTRTLAVLASYNRVVNNSNSAVSTSVAGTLSATMENNWWGCNAGPGNTGCDTVAAGVDFDPWLVLAVSASPNPIAPGATSTVTADMTHNSDGADTSAGGFVPPISVGFAATQGSVSPTSGTITSGQATTTYTSASASTGTAFATVDNQTASTNVNVTTPAFSIDNVTQSEGDSGTTAFTFTVTKTGATAFSASVDFATANGTATAPSDYTAASGTLTFASNETTKQITVFVNGDLTFEPNETFTVHLSNPSGATIGTADGTGTITNDDASAPASIVYVDDDWAGTSPGADPDGAGPATKFGYDAFSKIQDGVNAVASAGTVNVYAGTYDEDVAISNAGMSLAGFGAGTKTVRGAIGGDVSTIHIFASNVTVAGFTITRLGNNTAQWNDPGLNSAGIAIQGLAVNGALIRDNTITGNRTGIDINNSGGHTIRNNSITDNRTGLLFRNQTDHMTVVENFITNNWTVGVLFIDASGGTNSPAQTALHSTFSNNDLSGNWYGQAVDRQSGGSLPAPGTTNLKNFRGNWWGTTSPVVTTANSAEPGYSAQIPVEFGGTASAPGGQPDIAGPASANIKYLPLLMSGTDTNVETTPGRGTNGFQGVASTTIVRPSNQQGWAFFDDNPGTGTGTGGFEDGPGTPPLGVGSAFLQVDGLGRHALGNAGYTGTRMDDISALNYATYQNNNSGPIFAISLQFDIDYDLNDTSTAYMGRLVFEPYQTPALGAVQQNVWQTWNALAGKWYGTRSTVTVGNASVSNPCQQATPCTWQQVIALFPNAGVRNDPTSLLLFKAGGPWTGGFDGNVDALRVSIGGAQTAYDFESLPTISINDVTQAEGDSGTTAFNFNVTLSRASDQTVTVDYATADGTATVAGGDYSAASGTVTFNPGETSKQVGVQVNGDTLFEANETFFVNLSNPNANATILDAQGMGTITNDDPQPPAASIDDVTIAEPQSGTSNAVFTVTLSNAFPSPVSIDFSTADGTATAPADYLANNGTLTFAPGETTKQISVTINADALAEGTETFTVNLSNPTAPMTIADATGLGTIADPVLNGQVVISEFRFRGAAGARDEFVELYNNTNGALTVAADDGTPGWSLAAVMADGTTIQILATIPAGTVLAPRSHYLVAGVPTAAPATGYSLGVAPSLTYDADIADGTGVGLFRTNAVSNVTSATRLDAVGFSDLATPVAALFREGAGLASPGANDGEYSFVRSLATGLPKDTGDNASDFIFVSTDAGSYGGVQSVLGAPGPENRLAPINRGATIKAKLVDSTQSSSLPPNRLRDGTVVPNGSAGTITFRRRFTNNTGTNVTQLRFRVVDVTTLNTPNPGGAQADLRLVTSATVSQSGINDATTCSAAGAGSPPCTVTVEGLTLETPPAQPSGGGYNSTVLTGSITPALPLAPNASVNVQFTLGVQQTGSFRFFVIVEALLDSDPTSSPASDTPAKHSTEKAAPAKQRRATGNTLKMN